MKFALSFVTKFAHVIVAILGCFDRVIFKGYLPFWDDKRLNDFVDYVLKMRRKDFLPWLEQHSQMLVQHAQKLAAEAGRPYEFKQGKFKKETFIQNLIRQDNITQGLVAVLCVMETCRSVTLKRGKTRPWLSYKRRPQRVLYYYFLDREFGLMHIRLETWFPYGIQVYVNGHDWLAQQMQKKGLGFVQQDNAFTFLENPKAAQKIADRFAGLNWPKQLSKWSAGESAADARRMAEPLGLLLGHRSGGIRLGRSVRRPQRAARALPTADRSRRGQLLGQRHPDVSGPEA